MVGRQRAQENNSVKSIHFPVNVVFLGVVSACEGTEVLVPVQSCQFGSAWAGETELWLAVTVVLSSKGIKSYFLSVCSSSLHGARDSLAMACVLEAGPYDLEQVKVTSKPSWSTGRVNGRRQECYLKITNRPFRKYRHSRNWRPVVGDPWRRKGVGGPDLGN